MMSWACDHDELGLAMGAVRVLCATLMGCSLCRQVVEAVAWEKAMGALVQLQCTKIVETGPGMQLKVCHEPGPWVLPRVSHG